MADEPTNCLRVGEATYCIGAVYGRQPVQLYRLDGDDVYPAASFHTAAVAESFRAWLVSIAHINDGETEALEPDTGS